MTRPITAGEIRDDLLLRLGLRRVEEEQTTEYRSERDQAGVHQPGSGRSTGHAVHGTAWPGRRAAAGRRWGIAASS
jgi:hypothetical protein